jgi:hypothetical protein
MAERSIEVETFLSPIRSRKLHRFLMTATSVLLLLFGGCYLLEGPPFYYSDPIHVRVVAQDTGQPVAGAVAFAFWDGQGGFGGHRYLRVKEAVSDQNGWFTLPGWRMVRPPLYVMTTQDPAIQIYKPGSYAESISNDDAHPRVGSVYSVWLMKRVAFWNGKTVPLRPLETVDQQVTAWRALHSSLDYRRLDPKRLPLTWRAVVTGYNALPSEQRKENTDPVEWFKIVQKLE